MVLVSLKKISKTKNRTFWQGWEQLEIFSPLTQLTIKGVFHLYKRKASKHSLLASKDINKTDFTFKSSVTFDRLFKAASFSLKQMVK